MKDDYGFPIGTKVELIQKDPTGYVKIGTTGTVCDHDRSGMYAYNCNIGVEWDVPARSGYHECRGTCEDGRGRYVPHTCLGYVDIDLGEITSTNGAIDALYEILV